MKPPELLRTAIPLVLGLAVGVVGATLFMESLPGAEGSPEERANKLELELTRAQKRIAALEAQAGREGALDGESGRAERTKRALADSARSIGEDLRAGRPVSPNDIFRTAKPVLRDLAPLFERVRVKQQRAVIDSMTGELARKYNLPPEKEAALKEWFEKRAEEEAKRWSDLLADENTGPEDVIRASHDLRPDEGLDTFMEGILPPDQFATFKAERLATRAERVQQEADMKVQRLDRIVGLDEAQRDQVFGLMARSSRDYDSSMVLEGSAGEISPSPGGDRHSSVLSVLRPEQRAAYEAERKRRYQEAAKEAEAFGLALPGDWELLDDNY